MQGLSIIVKGSLLAVLCLLALQARASITFDSDAASWQGNPSGASISNNFALGAGSDQILFVTVRYNAATPAQSVTFNGAPMTFLRSDVGPGPNTINYIYYKVNPTPGTHAVVVTCNFWNTLSVTAFSYSGVNTLAPIGVTTAATGAAAGAPQGLSLSFTPSVSTSTIVEMLDYNVGADVAATGYAVDNGTVRYSVTQAMNSNNHNFGFGDWTPGSTAPAVLRQTWVHGPNTGPMVAQAVELLPLLAATRTSTTTPQACSSVITYNNDAATITGDPGGSSLSGIYALGAGSEQILLVTVRYNSALALGTITYGGQLLTFLRSDSTTASTSAIEYVYYMLAPPAGTNTLTVYCTCWAPVAVTAFSYSGVNQSAPIGAIAGAAGNVSGTPEGYDLPFTPSTSTGTIVQMGDFNDGGNPPATGYVADHGTVRYSDTQSLYTNNHNFGFADWSPASAAPVVLRQTWVDPYAQAMVVQALELLPYLPCTPTATPTWSATVTPSPTTTPSPAPSATSAVTPASSATPTPGMRLVKTASVSMATIGDTITYCLAWQNDSAVAVTMTLWDSISVGLTYLGSDAPGGCSAGVVAWNFPASAKSSGTVCFWAWVSGYP